jgi:hypothetical protein
MPPRAAAEAESAKRKTLDDKVAPAERRGCAVSLPAFCLSRILANSAQWPRHCAAGAARAGTLESVQSSTAKDFGVRRWFVLLALAAAAVQAQTTWFTVTGNPDDAAVNTVQVDPVAVKTAGDFKTMNVRVSRSEPRINWDGVPYRSYESRGRLRLPRRQGQLPVRELLSGALVAGRAAQGRGLCGPSASHAVSQRRAQSHRTHRPRGLQALAAQDSSSAAQEGSSRTTNAGAPSQLVRLRWQVPHGLPKCA